MISLVRRSTVILIGIVTLSARAQLMRVDTLARAPQTQFPTSIAFVPGGDGAFFFGEKSSGRVRLFDGDLRPEPLVTLPVDDEGEQGLLGVAAHPAYPDSPFVYVFYVRATDRASILERYDVQHGSGSSPQLLLFIPRRDDATENNGGSLLFGPDGKLYVGVGDHGVKPSNAQDTLGGRNLRGKILRLNPDGSIPSDNVLPRRLFWSIGHRNPGGMAFDPLTGGLYVTEGGRQGTNAIVTVPRGANLGWPGRRPSSLDDSVLPKTLLLFPRGDQTILTGIAVYRGDAFPRMRGTILFTGNANPVLWAGRYDAGKDSLTAEILYRSNTGFSDVRVGPEGAIYAAVGPYLGSRLLKFSPVAPEFAGDPPAGAVQDAGYAYVPVFRGTPPELEMVAGPAGMTVDTTTWSVRWTPSNAQALEGVHPVTLRARNGAGVAEQKFTIAVRNVNDPPSAFPLTTPPDGQELRFLGEDPFVMFAWARSNDPDGDSIRYVLQLDSTTSFDSRSRIEFTPGGSDSIGVRLPPVSRTYFWRVIASDGQLSTVNAPGPSRLTVIVSKFLRREKVPQVESLLEQNFPNPFNPATSIKYTLTRGGRVRLTVFNLLGQEVATLVDGVQPEGTYAVEFTKTNLPSGIYFYRLIAPGLAETKKMVIAR